MAVADVSALRRNFSGTILVDGDEGFSNFVFPLGIQGAVVQPITTDDVVAALRFATENGLSVSIRSGGHSGGAWTSTAGGLVLDMSGFATVEITGTTVTVGSGATWGAVASALGSHGLVLTSGDTASVGVGGLTLGGGVGWLVRKHGLALDNLIAARVVTATGSLVTASATENPELFWALRGGGGNFGVVTDFTFQAHEVDGVVHGVISFDNPDLGELLRGYRDAMRGSAEELNATFLLMPAMGPEMPGGPQVHVLWAGSDVPTAMAAMEPLLQIAGMTDHTIVSKPYVDVLDQPEPPGGEGMPMPTIVGNNGWAPDFSDAAIDAVVRSLTGVESSVLMIRYLRGAFNRVSVDSTAFAWRDAEALVISVAFLPPDSDPAQIASIDEAWVPVSGFTRGTYGNFLSYAGERAVALMYPAETRARLSDVKRDWDPQNLFNQNQNIEPAR